MTLDDLKQRFADSWETGHGGMTLEEALLLCHDGEDRREMVEFAVTLFEDTAYLRREEKR